ncbi:MAG: hypothetical protein JO261_05955 [Alphaproteobacteria bacterium]|nr:hypothetical protein [Alphaproteobacteria bacterium]MBV9693226.1 hypothetical protein [Alphaproteobacteria bacterium]
MNRTLAFAALLACLSLPASAEEDYNYAPSCIAPQPPAPVDGHTATQPQLDAARAQVEDFMRVSDSYQSCLGRALGGRQELAFTTHSNVPVAIVKQIERKANANQKDKERVGREYNDAVATFKARAP